MTAGSSASSVASTFGSRVGQGCGQLDGYTTDERPDAIGDYALGACARRGAGGHPRCTQMTVAPPSTTGSTPLT
jgi:hypothetical protein